MKRVVFMEGYDADERRAIVERLFADGFKSPIGREVKWWAEKEAIFIELETKILTHSNEDYARTKLINDPNKYVEAGVKLERVVIATIVPLPPAEIVHEGYCYIRRGVAPCASS